MFELERAPPEPLVARYNMAPSQPLVLIRTPHVLEFLTWGLAPDLVPDGARKSAPKINVRAETVGRAPAYRDSFWNRRCLILVDGFYEWKPSPNGGKAKQPYFIRRDDGSPFALAGIWKDDACAILTGRSHGVVATLHSRAPVIVPREDYDAWLNPTLRVDVSTDDAGLIAYPVSTLVNSPANDAPECIAHDHAPTGETLSLFRES